MSSYPAEVKNSVVTQVQSGASVAVVAASPGILSRTIRKWVTAANNGMSLDPIRRGPKPRLPEEAERHICEWIVGHQMVGVPTDRGQTIRKAKEVSLLVCGEGVGEGCRNNVCEEDLATLFATLAKPVIELDLDESRVFNMDETTFHTKKMNKKVVTIRGFSSIWSTDHSVDFHLSVVVCGSVSGFVVPPAFISGKTVEWDIRKGCEVPGTTATTSPSGFVYL
ncbi:unnamed protein product [Phytophthora fragariaefolia]|uniref:Unnamed protein product n=1 Tax=Phytophthora fragariaefolia TaxID=1490495 RepID=A0A9W6Y7F0_9STRA|nr:unnamed protein product [Phytophthora fragariaefolia]